MTTSGVFLKPIVLMGAICCGWVDEWQERRCTFEGDVDGDHDTEADLAYWTCPECGTEYIEDPKEVSR